MSTQRFKLVFFCPVDQTPNVLGYLFNRFPSQLGKIGDYERCAFISRGTGQFLPVRGANPAIGAVGALERVEEDRVEIVVNDGSSGYHEMKNIISELKRVHPYEEVVCDVYKLMDF